MNKKDSISCITELAVLILLILGESDMICLVQATHKEFIKIKMPLIW